MIQIFILFGFIGFKFHVHLDYSVRHVFCTLNVRDAVCYTLIPAWITNFILKASLEHDGAKCEIVKERTFRTSFDVLGILIPFRSFFVRSLISRMYRKRARHEE